MWPQQTHRPPGSCGGIAAAAPCRAAAPQSYAAPARGPEAAFARLPPPAHNVTFSSTFLCTHFFYASPASTCCFATPACHPSRTTSYELCQTAGLHQQAIISRCCRLHAHMYALFICDVAASIHSGLQLVLSSIRLHENAPATKTPCNCQATGHFPREVKDYLLTVDLSWHSQGNTMRNLCEERPLLCTPC